MTAKTIIYGIHHITAITSSATENLVFYENVLGLRLVKQTVNFDDPYTYHLYYGDSQGSPGTILTFFPWESLPSGRPGTGMVTAITLAIPRQSIDFWTRRIRAQGIRIKTEERFGDPVIQLTDPHGLHIELIGTEDRPPTMYWQDSPISKAHAVTGFHSATSTLKSLKESETLLVDVLGMTLFAQEQNRYRFKMDGHASPGHFYDIVADPQAPLGKAGGGSVHHIAFRTKDSTTQSIWQSSLRASGVGVTDVRDRKYFRSIYFHTPEGVLFEIATDPPGFTVDESADELGGSLKLPDQYEPMRADIEKHLPALRPKPFQHIFEKPRALADDGHTFVTLHGTGGNEHDLVSIAAEVSPASAILSPRGKVLENGMSRFFKRLANNIFDEANVIENAHELSDFIISSTAEYGRKPNRITALGYSNGANIAAAVILLRPEVFSNAILLRPMFSLKNPDLPDLHGKKILILKGENDTVIPPDSTERLKKILLEAGADVTTRKINAGHEITALDLETISQWLAKPNTPEQKAIYEPLTQETA
jgi:predicted esterase/catechol 2,3-dioxygenase-like lactoylglutathione lyase family enzyme